MSHRTCLGILVTEHLFALVFTFCTHLLPRLLWREGGRKDFLGDHVVKSHWF